MAKLKKEEFEGLVRKIVREEIQEVVSQTINEVLSERYLKQLAEAAARPRGVGPTMHIQGEENEEESAPMSLKNLDQGIYHEHPSKHDDSIDEEVEEPELRAEHLERNEMLSIFFEGTKPLKQLEEEAGMLLEDEEPVVEAPTRSAPKKGAPAAPRRPLNEVWRELAGVKKKPEQSTIDPAELARREEARLKTLRESLDRPVTARPGVPTV